MLNLVQGIWLTTMFCGLLCSCSPETSQNQEPLPLHPDPKMSKIDIHAHYRAPREYLIPLFDSLNMRPLLVDVGRVDTVLWYQQREGLIANFQAHPGKFYFCTSFTANGIDHPDYAERIIAHLKHDLNLGASMVKVWKNFGMVSKDSSGAYVHIDDHRIQPVWDFLVAEGIPVLAHIGEPLQAWRPLDESNPHYGYYKNHPEYHAYQHPEIPSWEAIQEARNNWLAKNPELIVVGAHNGSMSHDVTLMAETLEKYPNFYLEPAARFGDLVAQDSKDVREFIINYQDRFLYGTDLGVSGDAADMSEDELLQEKRRLIRMMDSHWRYFTASGNIDYESHFLSESKQVEGLNLPDSVLRKIYYRNALKILGIPGG